MRPRGRPPIPSARSSDSEPVEIAPIETCAASFIFITAPLPNCRSICPSATPSACSRSWYGDNLHSGRLLVSAPYPSFSIGVPMMTLSAPLVGRVDGVLAADLKLDQFSARVDAKRPGEHGAAILFDDTGAFNGALADRFAGEFGLDVVTYEAPTKPSQFALLDHFGPVVRLCNVRLEELLRVEIYRRGLHSDAFSHENLRPPRPPTPVPLRGSGGG